MKNVIYVRADLTLHRRLEVDAERHKRPMAEHVRALLDEHLPLTEDDTAQAVG